MQTANTSHSGTPREDEELGLGSLATWPEPRIRDPFAHSSAAAAAAAARRRRWCASYRRLPDMTGYSFQ